MRALTVLIFILAAAMSPAVHAASPDQDPERESLQRLADQLAKMTQLIDEAEARADPNARIQFRYETLRRDLSAVVKGIEEHVQAPRNEPRVVPPLVEDYR